MAELRLEELCAETRGARTASPCKPGQEQFLEPGPTAPRADARPGHLLAARRARRRRGRRLHHGQLRCRMRPRTSAALWRINVAGRHRARASAGSPCGARRRGARARVRAGDRRLGAGRGRPRQVLRARRLQSSGETQYGENIGALALSPVPSDRRAAAEPRLRRGGARCRRRHPPGPAMTYGDVAAALGSRAARAVGAVMAHYGSDVPWWRVVRACGHPASRPREARPRALPRRGHAARLVGSRRASGSICGWRGTSR